jgi:hypothetical protein
MAADEEQPQGRSVVRGDGGPVWSLETMLRSAIDQLIRDRAQGIAPPIMERLSRLVPEPPAYVPEVGMDALAAELAGEIQGLQANRQTRALMLEAAAWMVGDVEAGPRLRCYGEVSLFCRTLTMLGAVDPELVLPAISRLQERAHRLARTAARTPGLGLPVAVRPDVERAAMSVYAAVGRARGHGAVAPRRPRQRMTAGLGR